MSGVSISDISEESSRPMIESAIENIHKELHGGRIRLAEIDARNRVEYEISMFSFQGTKALRICSFSSVGTSPQAVPAATAKRLLADG